MLLIYSILSITILYTGYRFYSKYIEKSYNITESEKVPSVELSDGVDYVPANKWILLGHHFSSIAGAGPIVGPIIAGIYFGWFPSILWIIIGGIFIGGVHDFSSLIISLRHKGKSIAEIANIYINKSTYKIFLIFIWFALMYVVAVFADITASTFVSDKSVGEISILYIIVALIFGFLNFKYSPNKILLTIISLAIISAGIYFSFHYKFIDLTKTQWIYILLTYAFIASLLPVWLLLQPRDYLSSYLLYLAVFIGLIGLFFGNYKISYPAFVSFKSETIGNLFPFLFVTIACGAISGFHSLVSSGTTSKQLDNIKNARFIGYGAMILESVVAVIALASVMILIPSSNISKMQPAEIYANAIGNFCTIFKINYETGKILGFLIISAFVLTTLDTATRIARYIFQELIEKPVASWGIKISATLISIFIPFLLLNLKITDPSGNPIPCWKLIWPVFGITNQLLAALVLVIIYIWVEKENYKTKLAVLIPAVFMLITTVYALILKVLEYIKTSNFTLVFYITLILLILSFFIVYETIKSLKTKNK